MKSLQVLILLISFSIQFTFSQVSTQQEVEKPTIALLGSFHFAGSSDMAGIKTDDISTPKRQKEIQALVDALALYKPTKVILEYPYGNTKLDSLYQLFLKDKHILSINERQQVGFRLAAQLGHKHIYPADHKMDLPFDKLTEYLQKENKMDQMQTMMGDVMELMGKLQLFYNTKTIKEIFVYMNNDMFDNLNTNLYLEYINKMGSESNTIGTEVVATWWHRNFKIMRNIDEIAQPEDRILVLFGQGHTAIFKGFYKTRNDYQYEDILKYLRN